MIQSGKHQSSNPSLPGAGLRQGYAPAFRGVFVNLPVFDVHGATYRNISVISVDGLDRNFKTGRVAGLSNVFGKCDFNEILISKI
jgi:hypothetical protein